MKAEKTCRNVIRIIDGAVNFIVLVIILLLIAFAGYALWDSKQIYQAADKSNYSAFKPTAENGGKSFQELQALNPDVFAWLDVYGTNIDYPVTQGRDNMTYVNTNAEGVYSLSGSIFLDCDNSRDFSDFNSILYGHHMARNVMFGDLDLFSDRDTFDSHRYANLYFDGKDHGIEFFAFVRGDAYDRSVFTPNVQKEDRLAYLNGLLAKAVFIRGVGVSTYDRIILLSTCSSGSTNGRSILVGRITDEVYENPWLNLKTGDRDGLPGIGYHSGLLAGIPILLSSLLFIVLMLLIVCSLVSYRIRKQLKKEEKQG